MNTVFPDSEKQRLAALKEFQILDTLPEREFDDITLLASQICETPIAAISLIDADRQWSKSRIGIDSVETPRDCAFCDYAIKGDNLFIVADAARDSRFENNILVTKEPYIRFYAGAPLITSDGHKLGTLCVIDRQARQLNESQKRALSALARSVMSLIEARNVKDGAILSDQNTQKNKFSKTENDFSKDNSFFRNRLKHYLFAALIVAIISLIKLFLGSFTQTAPFLLFVLAIILSAWRGGFGPGLFATISTIVIIEYVFLPEGKSLFNKDLANNISCIVFFVQGIFVSALCSSRLRSEHLLHQAGKDLENRIVNRTIQLAQANKELKQEIQERNLLQEDLRQARDSALESARLKSEFLANMSHEIRTPMNGVIGMTGLLLDTKLNEEQSRFAETIRSSSESLLKIINDILDFSKVEAGKLELETLDFNLRDTVESLIELFSNRAREQKNELAALIHSDVPLFLRGDAGRIRQVLTNLIGNAIKFTKFGDVLVRVENLSETPNFVQLKISVNDNGEGISKEVQSKLFQPFTQSDASTTRRFGGTGLGLSISKKIIEKMNGEIGLESKSGRGSTFWFSLTLEKQNTGAAQSFDNKKQVQKNLELKGKRVLIVDDNQINRDVLMYQTRAWKMETVEANDGVTAIDTLEKSAEPFDLVILDLQMPIMDGMETARQIIARKIQPFPPIIMISSSGLKMEAEKMRELGIKAFLNKPYRHSELMTTVCSVLEVQVFENNEPKKDSVIRIKANSEEPKVSPIKPQRILIVEDNTVNQMVAQNMLKKFGYHADIAANGKEALKALEIIPYDLVLMDCQMPEMDGYEATREIRARNWEMSSIPVIALTAHATEGEREKCLQAGMDDYISKPVDKENLRRIVAQWLLYAENLEVIETKPPPEQNNDENSFVAIDLTTLNEITGNDAELKREVLEIYLSQTVVGLADIENAINERNSTKLFELAHRTVSGSVICGMTAIVEPMRKLEKIGKEGNLEEAAPIFVQARAAFADINAECRRIL